VRPLDEWGNDAERADHDPASDPVPAPTVSPLEAAWADADRLHLAREEARAVEAQAHVDYRRAYDQAVAIGPRPTKVPT
jgi:hypothetical protein